MLLVQISGVWVQGMFRSVRAMDLFLGSTGFQDLFLCFLEWRFVCKFSFACLQVEVEQVELEGVRAGEVVVLWRLSVVVFQNRCAPVVKGDEIEKVTEEVES